MREAGFASNIFDHYTDFILFFVSVVNDCVEGFLNLQLNTETAI